jgi:hypothetical protein
MKVKFQAAINNNDRSGGAHPKSASRFFSGKIAAAHLLIDIYSSLAGVCYGSQWKLRDGVTTERRNRFATRKVQLINFENFFLSPNHVCVCGRPPN